LRSHDEGKQRNAEQVDSRPRRQKNQKQQWQQQRKNESSFWVFGLYCVTRDSQSDR
jgi:hypothetical protein